MAQPVTPQDHILAAAQRIKDQQSAARQLAIDLAAERARSDQSNQVQPPATVRGG